MEQEHPEPTEDRPGPVARPTTGRRGFLAVLGRAGLVVVGGVAAATATAESAEATRPPCPGGTYHVGCCCLAKPPGSCPGSGHTHTCNAGKKKSWTCCSSRRLYYCTECTNGSSCKCGNCTYYCSEAYTMGRTC